MKKKIGNKKIQQMKVTASYYLIINTFPVNVIYARQAGLTLLPCSL